MVCDLVHASAATQATYLVVRRYMGLHYFPRILVCIARVHHQRLPHGNRLLDLDVGRICVCVGEGSLYAPCSLTYAVRTLILCAINGGKRGKTVRVDSFPHAAAAQGKRDAPQHHHRKIFPLAKKRSRDSGGRFMYELFTYLPDEAGLLHLFGRQVAVIVHPTLTYSQHLQGSCNVGQTSQPTASLIWQRPTLLFSLPSHAAQMPA